MLRLFQTEETLCKNTISIQIAAEQPMKEYREQLEKVSKVSIDIVGRRSDLMIGAMPFVWLDNPSIVCFSNNEW